MLIDLARAYSDLGQYPEATNSLERAVELQADDLQAHAFLGVTDSCKAIVKEQWISIAGC
jgi:hypothetical protein